MFMNIIMADEIWVEHRAQGSSKIEITPEVTLNIFSELFSKDIKGNFEITPEVTLNIFAEQFRILLEKSTHSDITFLVGESKEEFKAHKAILSARSSYFEAMFRPEGMSESSKSEILIERHEKDTFSRMIEFIYTGEILDISKCCSSDVIDLLEMSMEYLLDDLGALSEKAASKLVCSENIGKLMLLCARYDLSILRDVCKKFVAEHGPQLRQDADFCQELQQYPELGLLILDAMQDEEVNSSHTRAAKRRRVTETTDVVPAQGGGANTIGTANQE
jgi:hypothetical protein